MPTPSLTPKRRKNHQAPAPAMPAAPVPLAKYDTPVDEYRVESWRNVSSPRPEENEANEIPNKRCSSELESATTYNEKYDSRWWFSWDDMLTSIPTTLKIQQPTKRLLYWTLPFKRYGQTPFATKAGNILQKAIKPFGVFIGTKSRAADSIITYKRLLKSPKRKNERASIRAGLGLWLK